MSTSIIMHSLVEELSSKEYIFLNKPRGHNLGLLEQLRDAIENPGALCISNLPSMIFGRCLHGCSMAPPAPDITSTLQVGMLVGRKKKGKGQ